jgi:hypothetical protein
LNVRAYIRHPSEFPIELCAVAHSESGGARDRLLDLSAGGLCCLSHCAYSEGERVTVRIPVGEPAFQAEGTVAWCKPDRNRFRVGIAFGDATLAFSARMVEQVCHIDRYHKREREQGRELSEEAAALEWISKYAKSFPR